MVVAWRPDRLFRSLWPAARLKQMMDATGVDVERGLAVQATAIRARKTGRSFLVLTIFIA